MTRTAGLNRATNRGRCPSCRRAVTSGVVVCPWCQSLVADAIVKDAPAGWERLMGWVDVLLPVLAVTATIVMLIVLLLRG